MENFSRDVRRCEPWIVFMHVTVLPLRVRFVRCVSPRGTSPIKRSMMNAGNKEVDTPYGSALLIAIGGSHTHSQLCVTTHGPNRPVYLTFLDVLSVSHNKTVMLRRRSTGSTGRRDQGRKGGGSEESFNLLSVRHICMRGHFLGSIKANPLALCFSPSPCRHVKKCERSR